MKQYLDLGPKFFVFINKKILGNRHYIATTTEISKIVSNLNHFKQAMQLELHQSQAGCIPAVQS